MRAIWMYAVAGLPFWILDAVWLGVVAGRFYRRELATIMVAKVRRVPAALFYLAYPAGLALFAVAPALASGGWLTGALLGGAFGLFCYGTYDLVNRATLTDWPLSVTVVDMAWGTVASAVTAGLAVWFMA